MVAPPLEALLPVVDALHQQHGRYDGGVGAINGAAMAMTHPMPGGPAYRTVRFQGALLSWGLLS